MYNMSLFAHVMEGAPPTLYSHKESEIECVQSVFTLRYAEDMPYVSKCPNPRRHDNSVNENYRDFVRNHKRLCLDIVHMGVV